MRGLDYKWIEALDAIVYQGSFERAAEQAPDTWTDWADDNE